jgi:hypothetical protein
MQVVQFAFYILSQLGCDLFSLTFISKYEFLYVSYTVRQLIIRRLQLIFGFLLDGFESCAGCEYLFVGVSIPFLAIILQILHWISLTALPCRRFA